MKNILQSKLLWSVIALSIGIFAVKNYEKSQSFASITPPPSIESVSTANELPSVVSPLSSAPKSVKIAAKSTPTAKIGGTIPVVEAKDEGFVAPKGFKKVPKAKRIQEAIDYEKLITRNLETGEEYTAQQKMAALEGTRRIQNEMLQRGVFERGPLQKTKWFERGPNDVGGRTRAMMVDLSDTTRQTLWAGHATGGVWRTKNAFSANPNWERINDFMSALSVSSMAQHPTSHNIIYVGTGDVAAGDAPGLGVFKTVDGGKTWANLPSTVATPIVGGLVVLPNGDVIAGFKSGGIKKSTDGGTTFRDVLPGVIVWKIERANDGKMLASCSGLLYRSSDNGETWQAINGTGFPGVNRIEASIAPTNSDVIYMVGQTGGTASAIFKTTNGGATWSNKGRLSWKDGCGGNASTTDFTRGQVWYDLSMAVSSTDPNVMYVGGVDAFQTVDGGVTFRQVTVWSGNCFASVHADHHGVIFDPRDGRTAYMGTDGGVWRIANASSSNMTFNDLNKGYVNTLFYKGDIDPRAGSNTAIAGAQDNGSILIQGPGISDSREVWGGDGFYSFIDQENPNNIIVSIYGGLWAISRNGGASFSSGVNANGQFVTLGDFDSKKKILYSQTNGGDLYRWNINQATGSLIDVPDATISANHVKVDRNVDGRIYIGSGGTLFRVDSAHTNTLLTTRLRTFSGTISCVAIERGNPNHLLVTNTGANTINIYESTDGGTTWADSDGNLPAMPVRWALFNPNNPRQAMIATDFGVWSTEQLAGAATVWIPPFPGRGTPLVRTSSLSIRESDNTVLAATYGRGLWQTNVFGALSAKMDYLNLGYIDAPIRFSAENSGGAPDNYNWNFGDGGRDTNEVAFHRYAAIGSYPVQLTINNSLNTSGNIKILPKMPTSYKKGTPQYGGDADDATLANQQFGIWTVSGSGFERGRSTVIGKEGTNSGTNAFVIAPNQDTFRGNSLSYLYTPNYDFSQRTIYEFSFYANYLFQNGHGGFNVEYSTDKGLSWNLLGTRNDNNWYSTQATDDGLAFPRGTPFFSNATDGFTKYGISVSWLAGQSDVAFRFVFRSSNLITGISRGVALDDIEVTKYDNQPKTIIIAQSARRLLNGQSIKVEWATTPEYNAQTFDIEVSTNGRDFLVLKTLLAVGKTTLNRTDYSHTFDGRDDYYYIRIRSKNSEAVSRYNYEFVTPIMVVGKDGTTTALDINFVFPSPFKDKFGVTFTKQVEGKVKFDLYDVAGRLVYTETIEEFSGVYKQLNIGDVAAGVYILSVIVDGQEPKVIKVTGGL